MNHGLLKIWFSWFSLCQASFWDMLGLIPGSCCEDGGFIHRVFPQKEPISFNSSIVIPEIDPKIHRLIPKNIPSWDLSLVIFSSKEEPGEVATALSALDSMNDLQNLPPSVLLAQLQDMLRDEKPMDLGMGFGDGIFMDLYGFLWLLFGDNL